MGGGWVVIPIGLEDLEDGAEVTLFQAAALFNRCSWAHGGAVVNVWEPAERFYTESGESPNHGALPPNRAGCMECQKFVRIVKTNEIETQ